MKVELVNLSDVGDSARTTWRELIAAQPFPNPLDDPDYLQCLADAGCRFEVIVVSSGNREIIFWPVERKNSFHAMPVALPVSDCTQFVAAKDVSIGPAEILQKAGFKSFYFDHLFQTNAFDPRVYSYLVDPCYLIRLESGFDSYVEEFRVRGSKLIAEARRKLKKLENDYGPVRLDPNVSNHALLDSMLEWKTKQLDDQGFQHPFQEAWVTKFMVDHLGSGSDHCRAKLSVLFAGDHPVAMHYGSWGYGSMNSWLPAVNPNFAKYSPALNLYLELVRYACDLGIRTIILGRGENQTKIRLSNFQVDNYVGNIRTSIIGKIGHWGMKRLYGFRRSKWGKFIREKIRQLRKSN